MRTKVAGRTNGGRETKAQLGELTCEVESGDLVAIGEREEHLSTVGQARARGELRLGKGDAEALANAHDLTGRAHLGSEQRVDTGKTAKGQHGFFDTDVVRVRR